MEPKIFDAGIGDDLKLGKDVILYRPSNLFGCELGDETLVGPFVEIQRGVKVGKKCDIHSHSFVCTGVTIEDNVFIGHGVMFINTRHPTPRIPLDTREIEPVLVKKGARIGSGVTVMCGVTIGEDAEIGAGAVVVRDVPNGGIAVGNPARVIRIKGEWQ